METGESIPQKDVERQIRSAQEQLKTISRLREKLEILTEHVESRREALEEEIEESLHESIRNARDCLEKIQENIAPKLDKAIEDKLGQIDERMNRWKEESLAAVREEILQESPALSGKVLADLDHLLAEKIKSLKTEISGELSQGIESQISSALVEMNKTIQRVQGISYGALGASVLALLALVWLAVR